MTISYFWKPMIASLVVTPAALLLALISSGAGHGHYVWAKVFFPYTMLSTLILGSITAPFILLAILQYPFYGLVLAMANKERKIAPAAVGLFAIHVAAAAIVFLSATENFK